MTEELAVKYLKENNIEPKAYYDSALEQILDMEYFVKIGGQAFKLENHENLGCGLDFSEVHKHEDGSYDFHALFYNGGTCLSGMLEYAMDELNNKG